MLNHQISWFLLVSNSLQAAIAAKASARPGDASFGRWCPSSETIGQTTGKPWENDDFTSQTCDFIGLVTWDLAKLEAFHGWGYCKSTQWLHKA